MKILKNTEYQLLSIIMSQHQILHVQRISSSKLCFHTDKKEEQIGVREKLCGRSKEKSVHIYVMSFHMIHAHFSNALLWFYILSNFSSLSKMIEMIRNADDIVDSLRIYIIRLKERKAQTIRA